MLYHDTIGKLIRSPYVAADYAANMQKPGKHKFRISNPTQDSTYNPVPKFPMSSDGRNVHTVICTFSLVSECIDAKIFVVSGPGVSKIILCFRGCHPTKQITCNPKQVFRDVEHASIDVASGCSVNLNAWDAANFPSLR